MWGLLWGAILVASMGLACQHKGGPYPPREYGLHYECSLFRSCEKPLQCMDASFNGSEFHSCERACEADAECPQGFGCGPLIGSTEKVCLERLPDATLLQPYFDS